MSKNSGDKKKRLIKAKKKNSRLPPFVILKTNRKLTFNSNRRNWRTDKLRIKEE